jgi:hypothetical protein
MRTEGLKAKYKSTIEVFYNNCQKYFPIGLANLSTVIASEAKQSLGFSKRLLRR